MATPGAALLLTATLPVALLMGTGIVLRRQEIVEDRFRAGLLTLVLNLLFPALVLAKVTVNPALRDNVVALSAPVAGFLSSAIGLVIARLAAPLAGADTSERRRAFAYTAGHYNYSYLAIPVCTVLYGPESIAVLLLFNLGIEFSLWTVGIMTLTGGGLKDARRRMLNPITVSMLAAIVLNRTGIGAHLPDWSFSFLNMLGACAVPLGLMLVGMGIPALLQGFRAHHDPGIAIGAVVVRNLLVPGCFALAAVLIAPLPAEVRRILLLQAAMPAGTMTLVMCQHYGIAPQVGLRVFVASTLAAIVTLPLWLWIGGRLAAS